MKTYNTLFMLVTVLTQTSGTLLSRFQKWADTHSVNISDPFKHYHIYSNWLNNDKFINETNSLNLTYTLGHNAYSGYNSDEFFNLMGFITGRVKSGLRGLIHGETDLASLPTSVDWRTKGVVNQVQDQGQCGSCWAFSTVQAIESASAIKYGILPKLSEQELVDCDTLTNGGRDHGCNGGIMDNAFTWVGKNGGVCSESAYPYTSGTTKNSGSCNVKSCSNVLHTSSTSHVDVLVNSDNALMSALAQQPVAVAIEADQRTFQLYSSGVFTGTCGNNLDHGVGLVGYGTLSGVDYYILRNSWGKSWGIDGYMYLGRGNDPLTGKPYNNGAGQCGVLGEASYPLVN